MQHWHYLRYVCRHKYFVFLACLRLRVPFHQALVHDWTKLLPDEFGPYAAYFYGPKFPSLKQIFGDARNWAFDSGCYREKTQEDFDRAWLAHQHRSPHHWQHWILRNDDGDTRILEMPDRYLREMLADWRGAGRALGKPDTVAWYQKNRDRIALAPITRALVEGLLGVPRGALS